MGDELDRMLSVRDEIVPSSGFVASVMDAVRHEAAAAEPGPFPPLSFPWVRALPVFAALVAVVVMLVIGLVEIVRTPVAVAGAAPVWLLPPSFVQALEQGNAGWIAFALLLAFVSTLLSLRFATGRR